jgi:hypothetical protein
LSKHEKKSIIDDYCGYFFVGWAPRVMNLSCNTNHAAASGAYMLNPINGVALQPQVKRSASNPQYSSSWHMGEILLPENKKFYNFGAPIYTRYHEQRRTIEFWVSTVNN